MTSQLRAIAGLLALLAMAYGAYSPGLSGGFLFDDFVNLNAIGATGPVDNWPSFLRYITSGAADPTGRPLALLSFLIDARDWPADPASFLRTNLIIHLINGSLLFWLLRVLGRLLDAEDSRADAAAWLAAGMWLLHPLLVSTTLYAVQREAMLPATFILIGLLCYVRGHSITRRGSLTRGTTWMVVGIVGGTGLALLCKGNGILLPLLAWTLDATILQHGNVRLVHGSGLKRLRWLLLTAPSVAVLMYLASFLSDWDIVRPERGWTIGQRVLTEARVIVDYLHLLLVPRSISTGLYNDAYLVSTDLLQPLSTLACLLIVLFLPAIAWRCRKRYPAFAAAILFYFSGHLLESSTIALELYFEHRNYLPAMLLFWPLARGICAWNVAPRWRASVAIALIVLLSVTTYKRAELWGKPQQLAELWVMQSPASSRAQATVAMMETGNGQPEMGQRRLQPIWARRPHDLQIAFNYINAACAFRGISESDSQTLANALQHADTGVRLVNSWLGKAIEVAESSQCPGLSLGTVESWIEAALSNPRFRNKQARGEEIEPLLARLAIRSKQPDAALRHFDNALIAFTTPDVAASQASELARNGYFTQALAHLDTYERLKGGARLDERGMRWLHAAVLRQQGYWPREMAVLRAKLRAEIADGDAGPPFENLESLPRNTPK